MKKLNRIIFLIFISFIFLIAPQQKLHSKSNAVNFVIIFPGGPDTQQGGANMINQFISNLSSLSGIASKNLNGVYFNDMAQAKVYLNTNMNSFIMGSLGFFLSNKSKMSLVPLATINLGKTNKDKYFLIVKKGSYKKLSELKGKTLSGNIIYEDSDYIDSIVFNNSLKVSTYFKLKPTSRPLSAVRRLTRKRLDAVLLNKMQYESLKTLDIFSKIDVVYESKEIPALGLMMVNNSSTNSYKGRVLDAITKMCSLSETKEICKNFGLSGFVKIKPGELDEVINKYSN